MGGHRISPLFCPERPVVLRALLTRRVGKAGLMKQFEEIMEILEAFDLTGCLRAARRWWAVITGRSGCGFAPERRWGRLAGRVAYGRGRAVPGEGGGAGGASRGRIRADKAHERLVVMGYTGSERTTRRAVARAKHGYREEHGRRRGRGSGAWAVDSVGLLRRPVAMAARRCCFVRGFPGRASGSCCRCGIARRRVS